MEVAQDTLPELQPIFTFLNSHSNKLYQEGYFLKLNDLDSREFGNRCIDPLGFAADHGLLTNPSTQMVAQMPIAPGQNALHSS
jgi:hypothetical protein